MQVLTNAVKALHVADYQRVTIDNEISDFHVNLAACERLYSQPIPVAYTRHTSRSISSSHHNVFTTLSWPLGTPPCAPVGPSSHALHRRLLFIGALSVSGSVQVPDRLVQLPALCPVQPVPVAHALCGCAHHLSAVRGAAATS